MYEYQKNNKYFAQVTGQMEALCEKELIELGASNTTIVYRGIAFEADFATLYRINYCSRLATRILAPLRLFHCFNSSAINKAAAKIQWEDFIGLDDTFAISSAVVKSQINNSLYAAQCLKDGIADYFRDKYGRRPDVDTENPTVRLNLYIEKDEAIISIDTSGESLHKRGYRILAGEAPMQETLAAAMVRISGWDGEKPLWDCMCGSGTILCEAVMHYCRIPAQILRKNFGFTHLPDFDASTWEQVKGMADSAIRPLPDGLVNGNDLSGAVLDIARQNLARIPYQGSVKLTQNKFQKSAAFENGVLITNPPYGIRLGREEEAELLFEELGDFIKNNCKGTTAFIYTGNPELRKYIGLKTSQRVPLVNGKLEGVLFRIDSYEGSKKNYYQKYVEQGEARKSQGTDDHDARKEKRRENLAKTKAELQSEERKLKGEFSFRKTGERNFEEDRFNGNRFDRDDRSERKRFNSDDRPERKRFDRDDRPERKRFNSDDRPERKHFNSDDRPERKRFNSDDRPE
ncbi:MAG: THUMP domain-containing protein, partial [Ignavibacteria bacterium]|nr:THUMP domain-containing protein [Ignavibacteria bacterium]